MYMYMLHVHTYISWLIFPWERQGKATQHKQKEKQLHNTIQQENGYSGGIQTHETSTHILGNTYHPLPNAKTAGGVRETEGEWGV